MLYRTIPNLVDNGVDRVDASVLLMLAVACAMCANNTIRCSCESPSKGKDQLVPIFDGEG